MWCWPRRSQTCNRRRFAYGAMCGFVVAIGLLASGVLYAQPANPPTVNPAADGPDKVDDRPPLPPEERKPGTVPADFRFQNAGNRVFAGSRDANGKQIGGIEDNRPVLSEKESQDEYNAWTEAVLFAKQFSAADLEQFAARDLIPEDLTRLTSGGRSQFRMVLIRLDGKLLKVRKVPATKILQEAGLESVYEGWLVPIDEHASKPVCVVFTDLPPGLELGVQPENRWCSFAGYFFKVMAYPGPQGDPKKPDAGGWLTAPLLLGRSITLRNAAPAETKKIPLDKELRIFKAIRDDTPAARGDPGYWEEAAACNRILLHASKFPTRDLEAAARKDLRFGDLFLEVRRDFKLELVHFQGRLISLRKQEVNPWLTEAGIDTVYEGWLVPKDEPRGNPVCILITELPAGVEPQKDPKHLLNLWVSFAGYSFKLLRYESGEQKKDDPSKFVWKQAPLLIGHSVTLEPEPNEPSTSPFTGVFLPGVFGGLLLIIVSAVALSWWFRKGDRRAKQEMEAVRARNPFGETQT